MKLASVDLGSLDPFCQISAYWVLCGYIRVIEGANGIYYLAMYSDKG